MEDVFHTKLGGGRRIAIPAEVCEKLGLQLGDPLAIKVGDDGLQLIPFEHVVRDVQKAFAHYRKPGSSQVDELIRDRREEAKRDERD